MSKQKNAKKWPNHQRIVQGVGLLLLLMMVAQLWRQDNLDEWWQQVRQHLQQTGQWHYLALVLLLMPLNWYLETQKWRLLMQRISPMRLSQSWKAVLAGISVSVLTPGRIGEYAGRILVLPSRQWADTVLTTLLGSLLQWMAFVVCGWPSAVYVLGTRAGYSEWLLVLAAFLPLLALLAVLYNAEILLNGLIRALQVLRPESRRRQLWLRWLRLHLNRLMRIRRRHRYLGFGLALARFVVYSFQYLLLLFFFGAHLPWLIGLSGVFCVFFIQAGIPLPPGMGVISRSAIAVLVFGEGSIAPLTILSATLSLFMINLLLPSLLGILFIVQKKG